MQESTNETLKRMLIETPMAVAYANTVINAASETSEEHCKETTMRKTMLATGIAVATMGMAALSANADEGMWVPQQLPEIAGPLKKAGLKLDPKQLADLTGDPMGQMRSWALLLLCFDLIYWSLGGILFPFVIEEG